MFDLKKNIAQELAYLIVQNEITKISKLHKTIHHLYTRAKIPTFGSYIGFEKAFIFVAAKHTFKIDLSKTKLFHDIADSENLLSLPTSRLQPILPPKSSKRERSYGLLYLNINHAECNLITNEDLKRVNIMLAKHAQAKDELKHITRMYIGYRIMQDVFDGKILSA